MQSEHLYQVFMSCASGLTVDLKRRVSEKTCMLRPILNLPGCSISMRIGLVLHAQLAPFSWFIKFKVRRVMDFYRAHLIGQ